MLLLPFQVFSQDTARSEAALNQATVYLGYGAELVHLSKVKIDPATRTIVLKGLATNVDLNSLQISCPENVPILSHHFRVITPGVPIIVANNQTKTLQDSIQLLRKEISRLDNEISIQQDVLSKTGILIETTISTSDNKTVASAEVLKLVDYYNQKIEKCKTAIFNFRERREQIEHMVAGLQGRIQGIQPSALQYEKAYGQLTLQVLARSIGEIPVSISYYTPNAGWTALYDVRVNSRTNKVKMVYKASVTQTTGIDWKKTRLTLSTGTPTFGVAAPELSPWYLQLYVPAIYDDLKYKAAMIARDKAEQDKLGYFEHS